MPSEPIGGKLRDCLNEFAEDKRVTPEALKNLEAAITRSPALTHQLNEAADKGELKHFRLKQDTHAGGSFQSRSQTMSLGLDDLTGKYDANNMTFVLGHEVQHGVKAPGAKLTPMDQARDTFTAQAGVVAASAGPVHDYTPALSQVMQAHRENEAKAHLQGWNALVGAIREKDPSPSLEDIYKASPRAADFIEMTGSDSNPSYRMKKGLALEKDQTLSLPNADNVKAMGEYYFGKSAGDARLGYKGGSDYTNLYGASYVGELSRMELDRSRALPDATQVQIDMKSLGFKERTLERNGIDLGSHAKQRLPYYDISDNKPELSHFDHTVESHDYIKNNKVKAPTAGQSPNSAQAQTADLRDERHPGHAMFQGIRNQLGAELQRQHLPMNEGDADRVAAALAVAARRAGIDRPDHIVLGNKDGGPASATVFAVAGKLDDPAHLRASVSVAEAIKTPVEESTRQLDAERETAAPARQPPAQQNALQH
jgi:hypothetical protein